MLNPAGLRVASAPARTSSWPATASSSRPPLSAGALEGITQDSVIDHRPRPRLRGRLRRAHPQRPLHRRGDVRVRHRRRGVGGQLGRRPPDPVPRPDDHGHRRGVRARPSAARSTATRTGSSMSPSDELRRRPRPLPRPAGRDLRHDPARRRAVRGHLAHRRRQAARRRAARPARRGAGSRAATRGPTRRTRSSSGGPSTELKLSTATLVAFGSTRRPAGQGRRRPDAAPPWSRPARPPCASSASRGTTTSPRRCRPRSTRAWRWSADSVRVPEGRRAAGVLRRRALLRRLQGQPRVRPAGARGGGHQRRRLPRAVRHQRRLAARTRCSASSARSSAYFGDDQRIGIHAQNDSGCAVANSVAAVLGGATQLQGTINGYGERTGNANLMTFIPNLDAQAGRPRACPRAACERLTAVSRHVAELVNLPPHPADPYVGPSAFAHKGGPAHLGARQGRRGHLRAHRPRRWSATAPACWCRTSAAGPAWR